MEAVSETIYSLYRKTPFRGEWIVACLDGAWSGILGDRLAGACRPLALRDFRLIVGVCDKSWLAVLSGMKEELLARVRRATGGEVRELKFQLQADE